MINSDIELCHPGKELYREKVILVSFDVVKVHPDGDVVDELLDSSDEINVRSVGSHFESGVEGIIDGVGIVAHYPD